VGTQNDPSFFSPIRSTNFTYLSISQPERKRRSNEERILGRGNRSDGSPSPSKTPILCHLIQ